MIILSDIHLGREDSKVKELLKFIEERPTKKIVFNGDIFDQGAMFRDKLYRTEHRQYVKRIRAILKARKTKIYYIVGNHDSLMLLLIPFGWIWGVKIRKRIQIDGILIEHGDWITFRLWMRGVERDADYHVNCVMYAIERRRKLVVGHSHHPERLISNTLVIDDGDWTGNNTYVTINNGVVSDIQYYELTKK